MLIQTLLVDFVVLLQQGRSPRASTNIGHEDATHGFYVKCKDECPTEVLEEETQYGKTTFPAIWFCKCIANLLVEDLTADFATVDGPTFSLGEYREVEAPHLAVGDGHTILQTLMMEPPEGCSRKPGRLTVWIADDLPSGENMELEGSTYLWQEVSKDTPGPGVLLLGSVSRNGHRLSHETGHAFGFHHVVGADAAAYVLKECGDLQWPVLTKPSCEVNIMGAWYDGPYCCPGVTPDAKSQCLPNDGMEDVYCCGDLCTHSCPKTKPVMTFDTVEHGTVMKKVMQCWMNKQAATEPDVSLLTYTADFVEAPPKRQRVSANATSLLAYSADLVLPKRHKMKPVLRR